MATFTPLYLPCPPSLCLDPNPARGGPGLLPCSRHPKALCHGSGSAGANHKHLHIQVLASGSGFSSLPPSVAVAGACFPWFLFPLSDTSVPGPLPLEHNVLGGDSTEQMSAELEQNLRRRFLVLFTAVLLAKQGLWHWENFTSLISLLKINLNHSQTSDRNRHPQTAGLFSSQISQPRAQSPASPSSRTVGGFRSVTRDFRWPHQVRSPSLAGAESV